jgi:hypothetical protein
MIPALLGDGPDWLPGPDRRPTHYQVRELSFLVLADVLNLR